MNGYIRKLCLGALLLCRVSTGVNNPLPVALDGAVLPYNGAFYAMEAATNGQMLASENLVDWGHPVAVLPGSVAGPYELIYRGGLFYLYAQNLGYAVSDNPQKPFSEIQKAGLSGTEMRLYQDPSGVLFSVNRQEGSKREGEIWLQRYASPWKPSGKPEQLLDGRRGMWDSLDSADLGEPEIFGYRGNYYLLYAANNPSPRTGLRKIGVAMNENPLRLENTDKLSDPVLTRNAERHSREYEIILPTGEFSSWRGRYTMLRPEGKWTDTNYTYSKWRTNDGGFGYPDEIDGAQLHACRTKWESDQIWVRREFNLKRGIPETPVLKIRHEGTVQVFINGRNVYESIEPSVSYSNYDISEAAKGVFQEEGNVIAVHAKVPEDAAYRFLDFGLMDAGKMTVEPTVYGINSPHLISGPNGFEKWVTYQAWWNGVPGTGLDRVFFYDKELVIDGPTTESTPGYHPPPAPPTFSETFPVDASLAWTNRWRAGSGAWMPTNGVMRQSESRGTAKVYLNRKPMVNYLFETSLRFTKTGKGSVGVVAWSDGEYDLIISINRSSNTWSYHVEPGRLLPKKYKLPSGFKFLDEPSGVSGSANPLHRLRVTKNGGYIGLELDGIDLLPGKPLITKMTAPGVPGFYCNDSAAEFDSVTYTVGWDEYDQFITGWGDAADGTTAGGEWRMDTELGLQQRSHSVTGRAFKGDLLDQYEFTANAQLEELEEGKDRLYGVFPVFVDKDNYLKAMIDTRARELIVSGRKNGEEIPTSHHSLKTEVVHQHIYDKSTSYRNVTAWVYALRSQSVISGLKVRWLQGEYEHLEQEFVIPSDIMVVKYAELDRGRKPNLWEDGRFYVADEPKPRQQMAGIYNEIEIRPEVGNYVGFGFYDSNAIVVDGNGNYLRPYTPGENLGSNESVRYDASESDNTSRPQETLVMLDVESSYFFRCVKLDDRVIIELNGRPMVTVEESWPASQVGLITDGQPAFFNGITLMQLPKQ